MTVVNEFEHNGFVVEIVHDELSENPLDLEDVVKVVVWHPRYNLGNCEDFPRPEDFEDYCKENEVHRLPLYLYDHSGLTVSTSPFPCAWDSGRVGWVFVTAEDAERTLVPDENTEGVYNKALNQVVEVLDQYLRGEVYGYRVYKKCPHCGSKTEEIESCWGFVGDQDECVVEAAKEAADGG